MVSSSRFCMFAYAEIVLHLSNQLGVLSGSADSVIRLAFGVYFWVRQPSKLCGQGDAAGWE